MRLAWPSGRAARTTLRRTATFLLLASAIPFALSCGTSKSSAPPPGTFMARLDYQAPAGSAELGDVDTVIVALFDGNRTPIDSAMVLAPPPSGEFPLSFHGAPGEERIVIATAFGDRPVFGGITAGMGHGILWRGEMRHLTIPEMASGDAVAITMSPFVPVFGSVIFLDDGARHRLTWSRPPGSRRFSLRIVNGQLAPRDTLLSDTTFAAERLPAVYQVSAADDSGRVSAPSDKLEPGLFLPSKPVNFRLTVRSGEQVDVRWASGGGSIDTWELSRRGEDDPDFLALATIAADTLLYRDTTLVDGRRWEFRLRGRNGNGVSGWTTPVAAITPLNAPGSFTATVNDLEVSLVWNDLSRSETGYEIQRGTGSGPFEALVMRPVNSAGWVDLTVEEDQTYRYRARALGDRGPSAWSDQASAVTPLHLPSAPGGLTVQVSGATQISSHWGAALGKVDAYEVDRRTGDGSFALRATLGPSIRDFIDTNVLPATTYFYRVRARNRIGSGAWSNEASATTPAPPPQ